MERTVDIDGVEAPQEIRDRKVVEVFGLEVIDGLPVPRVQPEIALDVDEDFVMSAFGIERIESLGVESVAELYTPVTALIGRESWRERFVENILRASNLVLYSPAMEVAESSAIFGKQSAEAIYGNLAPKISRVNNLPWVQKTEKVLGRTLREVGQVLERGIYKFVDVLDGERDINTRRAVLQSSGFAAGAGGFLVGITAGVTANFVSPENAGAALAIGTGVAGTISGIAAYGAEIKRVASEIKTGKDPHPRMKFNALEYYIANTTVPNLALEYYVKNSRLPRLVNS